MDTNPRCVKMAGLLCLRVLVRMARTRLLIITINQLDGGLRSGALANNGAYGGCFYLLCSNASSALYRSFAARLYFRK